MNHSHKPDDTERRKWQNPEAILAEIGLKAGSTFVDAGCGGGFFTLPAARIAGRDGRVWAFDTNAGIIQKLKHQAKSEGIDNLILATGKAEHTVVCRHCADIVFYGVVFHDFEKPSEVLANARLMLKPGGRLVNLDWKKELMRWGPSVEKKLSPGQASKIIESAGFKILRAADSGPYHYIIVAE
ncbi:MAG: methyltransferase domain-containing protein [Dehalococcoidaceae bacterium]|nr:methyltransferase domain-containing protein [Dehalococcoidaceae bacterium]